MSVIGSLYSQVSESMHSKTSVMLIHAQKIIKDGLSSVKTGLISYNIRLYTSWYKLWKEVILQIKSAKIYVPCLRLSG